MKCKKVVFAPVVACLALLGCLLCACSDQGGKTSTTTTTSSSSDNTSSDTTSSSTDVKGSKQEQKAQDDAELQADKERITNLKQEYEHTVETKDDWADGVVVDALNNLAAQGVIAPLPEDFELFDKVFEFKPVDGGYDIAYLDEAAGEQLSGDFSLDLSDGSKVALCCELHKVKEDGSRLRDVTVPYTDKSGNFSTATRTHDEELLATPTLLPNGWAGTFADLLASVSHDAFANTTEECRYLIAYGNCYSNVVENYYGIAPTSEGRMPRTDATTFVFVIDAQDRSVVHIENIGTDVPGGVVDAAKGEATGKELTEEAIAYIISLLPSK